jgi:8-oxo-dGTP pyrophosphatase MutT (NUDIX family)
VSHVRIAPHVHGFAVIDRGDDLTVLLTLRADDLKHHAGQISFPGGRLEADDADATAAALRETEEEIGLRRQYIEILGLLPDHVVITGYRVTPVVGLVRPGFELVLDPTEVAGTFEAPLRHLLDPATHARRRHRFGDEEVETFDLPWGSFNIWGATAGMLITLREVLGGSQIHGN